MINKHYINVLMQLLYLSVTLLLPEAPCDESRDMLFG